MNLSAQLVNLAQTTFLVPSEHTRRLQGLHHHPHPRPRRPQPAQAPPSAQRSALAGQTQAAMMHRHCPRPLHSPASWRPEDERRHRSCRRR